MQEKEEKTEDEKRREKWFWLCSILSFGRKEKQMLLDFFGTPEEIWQADEREIGEVFWKNEEHKKAFFREKAAWDAKKAWNEMQKKGIRFISCEDTSYPQKLKEIYDYPFGLFIRGELPKENEKTVAIVGARLCSAYGRHFAVKIAEELAGYDISLVSGMARGIDGTAQRAAIKGGGKSYAVLGCGVDVCYPRDHIGLYMNIRREAVRFLFISQCEIALSVAFRIW